MPQDGEIDYIEIPGPDLPATKRFYAQAFGWKIQDYGDAYAAFRDHGQKEREAGGFSPDRKVCSGGPLVVLYANDLASMERKVVSAGGEIVARHEFPGGKRFHFRDPNGNELAVWSDK
ncbi:MAG: VOC family protein [Alphaproteobacteria bacterium]